MAACAVSSESPPPAAADGTLPPASEPQSIAAEDASGLAELGQALLVDARESVDSPGLAVGAVHIPASRVATASQHIAAEARLVVYADREDAAKVVARTLLDSGFRDVSILAGGIRAWTTSGNPVSGVGLRRKPVLSAQFDRSLSEAGEIGPALLLVYKTGAHSLSARDAIDGVNASSGFGISTIIVEIENDGSQRLAVQGPAPSVAFRDFAAQMAAEVLVGDLTSGRLVAIAFTADGEFYLDFDTTATSIAAIQSVVQLTPEERSPRRMLDQVVETLLRRSDATVPPSVDTNLAFFHRFCGVCGGGKLYSAVVTTAELADEHWVVLLPASIRGGSSKFSEPSRGSILTIAYDDLAPDVAFELEKLYVVGVRFPVFIPSESAE